MDQPSVQILAPTRDASEQSSHTYQQYRERAGVLEVPYRDPIRKRERLAQEARETKWRKITSTKMIANLERAVFPVVTLNLKNCKESTPQQSKCSWRRKLASIPKVYCTYRDQIAEKLSLRRNYTFQTQKKRGGGYWIEAAARKMKGIKSFNNAMSWVRVKAGKTKTEGEGGQVVIARDFNEAMANINGIAIKFSLSGVVEAGTTTHSIGGYLDQVFTNMHIANNKIREVDKRLSDHKIVFSQIEDAVGKIGGEQGMGGEHLSVLDQDSGEKL